MNPLASNGAATDANAATATAGVAAAVSERLIEGLWVVIPAYNEGLRIADVLADVLRFCQHVVVVDDASTDETAQRARAYPVWLVRHAINLGQGAALQTGITFALAQGAQYVVTFDADGQHQAADLPALLEPLLAGQAHYSLGSRFLGRTVGMPWVRRLLVYAARAFTYLFSGVRLTDAHNGLRAMTREGASRIHLTCNRMEHASEIVDQIVRSGLPFVEVPVTIRYSRETLRKGQRSSAALAIAARLLLERIVQ